MASAKKKKNSLFGSAKKKYKKLLLWLFFSRDVKLSTKKKKKEGENTPCARSTRSNSILRGLPGKYNEREKQKKTPHLKSFLLLLKRKNSATKKKTHKTNGTHAQKLPWSPLVCTLSALAAFLLFIVLPTALQFVRVHKKRPCFFYPGNEIAWEVACTFSIYDSEALFYWLRLCKAPPSPPPLLLSSWKCAPFLALTP